MAYKSPTASERVKSILFFADLISSCFFHFLKNTKKLCLLLLYFDWDMINHPYFFPCPLCFFPYPHPLFLPSVSLSYFILAVPMRECLGKHSCMSSQFPIAILYDTPFFLSLVKEKLNMPSGTIIGIVTCPAALL